MQQFIIKYRHWSFVEIAMSDTNALPEFDRQFHVHGQTVKDKATRETFDPALKIGQRVQDATHANVLYLRSVSPNRVSFIPSLIINQTEIDDALKILRKALDIVWSDIS